MGAVGGRRGPKPAPKKKLKRSDYEEKEVKQIEATIAAQQPAPGTNPLALSEADLATAGYAAARKFEDLPLSQNTKEGLAQHKFITLTAIQRAAIPHALAGRDILGAAKTGSGKTLAFLIPVGSMQHGSTLHAANGVYMHTSVPHCMVCMQRHQRTSPTCNHAAGGSSVPCPLDAPGWIGRTGAHSYT